MVAVAAGLSAQAFAVEPQSIRLTDGVIFTPTLKVSETHDDNFRAVGVKMFPALLDMTLVTNATRQKKEINIVIKMNEVKTDSNWESRSEVSSKYEQVSAEDVLNKIMSL